MFGFQRIGDFVWAFATRAAGGFLCGGDLRPHERHGEGLQHQDGHSLVLASSVPTCLSYDPAFAYEIAVIVQDGLRRMYQEDEDNFYYSRSNNENYAQPPMPEGAAEGIIKASTSCAPETQTESPPPGQRRWSTRPLRPSGFCRTVQYSSRRLERDQLQRVATRRAEGRAMESSPSGRTRTAALHRSSDARDRRPDHRLEPIT